MSGSPSTAWWSYHFFYHGDRDLALRHWLRPALADLRRDHEIETFFFVRYALGGPHLRLRLRAEAGVEGGVVRAKLARHAERFIASHPSPEPWGEEKIREMNRALAAEDPRSEDAVYPEGSLQELPFHPEVERYGGEARLDAAYDYFAISSLAALDFVAAHHAVPKSKRLPNELRFLLHQALGSSWDLEQAASFLAYPIDLWGEMRPRVLERGDEVFARRAAVFVDLVRHELEVLATSTASQVPGVSLLGPSARLLAHCFAGVDEGRWGRAATSHLHMSANRLGLSNAEELYVGRILVRALETWIERDPEGARRANETLAGLRASSPSGFPSLAESRALALAALVE